MLYVNNQPLHSVIGNGNSEQGRGLPKFLVADLMKGELPLN